MEERTIEGVDEQEAAELHRQIGFDGEQTRVCGASLTGT